LAVRFFEVEPLGTVRVAKNSKSRSLRLSITAKGEIRVSIPVWTPYQAGVDFAKSKAGWITLHKPKSAPPMGHGYHIGKSHVLKFEAGSVDKPTARLAGNSIRITRPYNMTISHPDVQKVASKACIRALRSEAEDLLPKRIAEIAHSLGFEYGSVSVKQLKGRWGSCDTHKDIVFNLFLMQLPWELIDYVIIHELTHTKHLNHSDEFWAEFMRHEPKAKVLRKRVRSYQPVLMAIPPQPMA
jgi:predicted metal-dependent hydrolase